MFNEQFVTNYIKGLTRSDSNALDIGANHGMYTALLAQKFAHVDAFEPVAANVDKLKEAVSGIDNITVHHNAISNVDGPVKIYRNPNNPGGHSISDRVLEAAVWGHTKENYELIEGITLDTLNAPNIGFIKCDVEGAENFIFQGAVKFLSTRKLTILLEVHQTVDTVALYNFFKQLKYTIYNDQFQIVDKLVFDTHYLVTNQWISKPL